MLQNLLFEHLNQINSLLILGTKICYTLDCPQLVQSYIPLFETQLNLGSKVNFEMLTIRAKHDVVQPCMKMLSKQTVIIYHYTME
mgnify:CR=1 FL=1